MKNAIVVTGGAGFVGSNLIDLLIKKTNYKIISLDNYSTGTKKNHIISNRVKYLKGNTMNISSILGRYKNKKKSIFHFGEFSRIFQSFKELIVRLLRARAGERETPCLTRAAAYLFETKLGTPY